MPKPSSSPSGARALALSDFVVLFALYIASSVWAANASKGVAWLPKLVCAGIAVVALWRSLAWIVRKSRTGHTWARDMVLLRLPPQPIYLMRSSPTHFDSERIPSCEDPLPALEGEWLSMGRDHAKLKTYAHRIDTRRSLIRKLIDEAIEKFTADRKKLVEQQMQILRLAFRAKRKIAFFDEIPPLSVSAETLPEYSCIVLPSACNTSVESALARRYILLPGGVGGPLGRLLAAPSTDNLIAAAIIAAVAAVHAKATLSKAARMLEAARGEANALYADARGTLNLLGKSHEEIVACSARLKSAEIEIEGLMLSLDHVISASTLHLRSLNETDQRRVKRLWLWVVCADAVHSRYAV